MNKYLALQKDVFDINKVTVVGNPTITSDGVASGFSSGNVVQITNTNIPNEAEKVFKMRVKWRIGNWAQTLMEFSGGGRIVQNQNGNIEVRADNNTSQSYIQALWTPENNAVVDYVLTINANRLSVGIIVDGVYRGENAITLSTTMTINKIQLGYFYSDDYALNGSIDLKEFKIYADNQLTYSPTKPTYLLERRKEGYDPSKFTIVGSPTITEYGVASGFSSENRLEINPIIQLGKYDSWEIITPKFTTNDLSNNTTTQIIFCGAYSTWYGGIRIGIEANETNLLFVWLASQSDKDSDIGKIKNYKVLPNTTYQVRVIFTGSEYICYYRINDTDWVEFGRIISNLKVYSEWNRINIGTINKDWAFLGSINLPSISITVDGKEVFTGAKENYYMLRR